MERAQNPDTIIDIYNNWRDKYDAIHDKYSNNVNKNNLKRKYNDDSLLISVPKNKKKRKEFYLEKSMELLEDQGMEEDLPTYNAIVFSEVTDGSSVYDLEDNDISQYFTRVEYNKDILSSIKKSVNSIINFRNQSVYVTGFAFFCHYQHDSDDCATEMVLDNIRNWI